MIRLFYLDALCYHYNNIYGQSYLFACEGDEF